MNPAKLVAYELKGARRSILPRGPGTIKIRADTIRVFETELFTDQDTQADQLRALGKHIAREMRGMIGFMSPTPLLGVETQLYFEHGGVTLRFFSAFDIANGLQTGRYQAYCFPVQEPA